MDTVFEQLNKVCAKCGRILVQGGIHMGVPFGHKRVSPLESVSKLYCAKCYDEITVVDNIQRTGDNVL